MKYDFETIIDRQNSDAIAVNPPVDSIYRKDITLKDGLDHIPMWIADMSFPTCPVLANALTERASHPLYGYYNCPDTFYDNIINWQKVRNNVTDLDSDCIGYENGLLGALSSALHVFNNQGGKLLVHAPMYAGFAEVIANCGYQPIFSKLKQDNAGIWRMDFEEMDRLLKEHSIHFALFCSPHNPTGRVWERWEIEKAMEIFRVNDVIVISDEIWSDLILRGHHHTPTQSVSEDARNRTIALYSPSKTFNLGGMFLGYHIIYNKRLRDLMRKASSLCHYNVMNVFSMHAIMSAYCDEGALWTDELCSILSDNVALATEFINNRSGVRVSKPEGTYLLLLDVSQWLAQNGKTLDELLRVGYSCGVDWEDGRRHHIDGAIRLNVALPRSRVEEAMQRLETYVFL